MQSCAIITECGIFFSTAGRLTSAYGLVGTYRKVGNIESWEYHDEVIDITPEQKLEFENKVRELICESIRLGDKY